MVLNRREWRPAGENRNQQQREESNEGNLKQSATTFFISKLPEGIDEREIWLECKRCGDLVDTYMARKRDVYGNLFGFVRFDKVKDSEKLAKALRNLRGWKLFVTVAKFEKGMKNKGKNGYDEGRRGKASTSNVSSDKRDHEFHVPFAHNRRSNMSYKEAVMGSENGKKELRVNIERVEPGMGSKWSGRSVRGEANSIQNLCNMKIILSELGLPQLELRYLGGWRF